MTLTISVGAAVRLIPWLEVSIAEIGIVSNRS